MDAIDRQSICPTFYTWLIRRRQTDLSLDGLVDIDVKQASYRSVSPNWSPQCFPISLYMFLGSETWFHPLSHHPQSTTSKRNSDTFGRQITSYLLRLPKARQQESACLYRRIFFSHLEILASSHNQRTSWGIFRDPNHRNDGMNRHANWENSFTSFRRRMSQSWVVLLYPCA